MKMRSFIHKLSRQKLQFHHLCKKKKYHKLECRLMISLHVLLDFKKPESKEVKIEKELDHKKQIKIVQTIALSILQI